MDQNIKDILEGVNFIKETVEKLPTEERVAEIVRAAIIEVTPGIIAVEVKDIRETVRQIGKRLNELAEQYANLKGVTKEIDDLRTQLRAVQKHLGIKPPVPAEA